MLAFVEAHTTMSLERRKRWNHDYEPLAAHAVGRFPERNQGIAHPFVPAPPTLSGLAFVCNLANSPSRQRPHRVLAMPTCRCTKLIENAPLLGPPPDQ